MISDKEFERYKEDTPISELGEFDYLVVPLKSVKQIIREYGLSCDGSDGIYIEQDAPIMLVKKGQKL